MTPLHEEPKEVLDIWKKSLPEDQHEQEEISNEEATGTIGSMVVILGVICTVILAIAAGAVLLLFKYRHLLGF
jgi:hypothetical protein